MTNLFDPEQKAEKTLIRKARQQQQPRQPINFSIAVLSTFGWYMSIPVLCGVGLGRFLDTYFPVTHISWTLNCVLIGFVVGIACVAYWVRKEGIKPIEKQAKHKKSTNHKIKQTQKDIK